MTEIIGVRFKNAGKTYFFSPGGQKLSPGDRVIVETARGIECGSVAIPNRLIDDGQIIAPLKGIIRRADEQDLQVVEENARKEKEAFKVCQQRIAARGLEMHLVDVEYTFDGNKILFYFTADGRVDFRELVKDLAGVFRTRIELRQIGVRLRHLRAAVLLLDLPRRLPAGVDQDGQGAEPFPQPHQNLRHLRAADVLPQI